MNSCFKQTKTFNRKRTSVNKIFSLRKIIKTYNSADDNEAISHASHQGHLEVVKFLSTLPGVDVSDCENWGICYASAVGHLEVVKYLSTLPGVDPSAQDNAAIRRASENGHLEVVEYLSTLPGVVLNI